MNSSNQRRNAVDLAYIGLIIAFGLLSVGFVKLAEALKEGEE